MLRESRIWQFTRPLLHYSHQCRPPAWPPSGTEAAPWAGGVRDHRVRPPPPPRRAPRCRPSSNRRRSRGRCHRKSRPGHRPRSTDF